MHCESVQLLQHSAIEAVDEMLSRNIYYILSMQTRFKRYRPVPLPNYAVTVSVGRVVLRPG